MSQSELERQPPSSSKRTRGRTGCLNCRARKKKCDETKPTCSRCDSFGDPCKWDDGFTFHNMGINDQHLTTLRYEAQGSSRSGPAFQIANVDVDKPSKRQKTRPSPDISRVHQRRTLSTIDVAHSGTTHSESASLSVNPATREELPSTARESPIMSELSRPRSGMGRFATPGPIRANALLSTPDTETESPAHIDIQNTTTDSGQDSFMHQLNNTDLGPLDFLTSDISNIDMIASAARTGDVLTWSPRTPDLPRVSSSGTDLVNMSSPDSIHYPNAMYRELHSTLHQHMVQTARATALNKQTDAPSTLGCNDRSDHEAQHQDGDVICGRKTPGSKDQLQVRCDTITPRRQLQLWRNYLDEIAPWLDMFDAKRHFQSTIPHMAKRCEHLNYSVLALSARQLERRSPEKLYMESLGLYQRALNMIVHRLQNLETEVIASCVLLCVLEMMSSSPKAWARHLDGYAMLLEAAGINGVVGGVRQAIFWCFARMDLWGGYLGDTVTKIPTYRWFIPSNSMASAVSQLKAGPGADTYANYAVFLCASVVNVISAQDMRQTGNQALSEENKNLYATRWGALYDLLEDWYSDRPEELLPLMAEQTSPNDYKHPFPIVLYATSPGISGNQMYHAATLLMLQHKPKDVRLPKSRKSMFWHARQICGIATSNADHNAWTNALQPLWIAGKVMSHKSEHHAILEILRRIEEETGFATEWRANDLKEHWGDESE